MLQYIFEATSTVTLFLVGRHCCLLIIKNIRNKVNFFNYVVEFLTAFHSFLELLSIRVSYFFNKKLVSFLILLCEKIPSSRLCFLCTVSYVPEWVYIIRNLKILIEILFSYQKFLFQIMSGFVLLKSNTIYMQIQTFVFEIEDVFTN